MPKQISDEEWDFLQNRRQVADFVESIYNDPALSKDAKRLIKRKYPALQIPDLDIEDKVDARFTAEQQRRDDDEKKKRQQREDEEFKKKRADTQKEYGFTDEAMARLEKLMIERNIGDYDVAASYFASKEPKPSEATYGSGDGFWNHSKSEGFAEIAKDPEGWGRGEIMRALHNEAARARGGR